MTIYSGFSHEKWWFSIAMLNYQRVLPKNKEKKHLFVARRFQVFFLFDWTIGVHGTVPQNWMFWRWFIGFHRLQVPQNAIDDHHFPYQNVLFESSPHTRHAFCHAQDSPCWYRSKKKDILQSPTHGWHYPFEHADFRLPGWTTIEGLFFGSPNSQVVYCLSHSRYIK